MNKKTIITALLALVTIAGKGQVKCHVAGTVAEGTNAVGLVIYRDGTDPKDSPLQLTVKDGRFECDVEDMKIERWHIVDFGEVLEKGMTSRSDAFFSEDGATVTITLDGDRRRHTPDSETIFRLSPSATTFPAPPRVFRSGFRNFTVKKRELTFCVRQMSGRKKHFSVYLFLFHSC